MKKEGIVVHHAAWIWPTTIFTAVQSAGVVVGAHLMAFSLPVYIGMPTLFVACVSRYSDTHTRALLSRTLPSIHQSVPSTTTTQKERKTTLTCCAEFHQIGGDAPWNWTRFNSFFGVKNESKRTMGSDNQLCVCFLLWWERESTCKRRWCSQLQLVRPLLWLFV